MRIQSLWVGPRLSTMERLCVESFLRNGHDYDLYAYGPVEGVPPAARLLDAASVLPESAARGFRVGGAPCLAAFSDAFRFKLLLDKGGVWADTDVVCLRPFELADDYVFPLLSGFPMLGREPGFSVDSWFLKAPRGCPFLRHCHETAMGRAGGELAWGEIGPVLIGRAVDRFALRRYARAWPFFPVNYDRHALFTDGSLLASAVWHVFSRTAVAAHLYREMWRGSGLDADGAFPAHSIYERLKRRYLAA